SNVHQGHINGGSLEEPGFESADLRSQSETLALGNCGPQLNITLSAAERGCFNFEKIPYTPFRGIGNPAHHPSGYEPEFLPRYYHGPPVANPGFEGLRCKRFCIVVANVKPYGLCKPTHFKFTDLTPHLTIRIINTFDNLIKKKQ
ncbi:hypothetical protein AVEN_109379-1, partial [Araneus ventricosus]